MRLVAAMALVGLAAAAAPAAAQSVGVNVGYVTLRGGSNRAADDILFQDQGFLTFSLSDFRNASVGGEVVLPLGNFFDVGVGADYYRRTVPSNYTDFVNANGSEITQQLRLQMVPVTATVRLLPFGRLTSLVPYVGGGLGLFRWKYTESGEWVDPIDSTIFSGVFEGSGTSLGGVAVAGVSVPVGRNASVSGELQYRQAHGNLPADQFASSANPRPRIDLSGLGYRFGIHWRF